MDDRKLSRRQLLKAAAALGVTGAALDPLTAFADEGEGSQVTWDLVLLAAGPVVTRGGHASANTDSAKSSRITVTGHGTFPNVDGCSPNVTGGGTWTVVKPATETDTRCFGSPTGVNGTYRVVELLSWRPAPGGSLPIPDHTGDKGKPSAGLATLRVLYDNGRRGTLTVSCELPGAPDCMFEGITASMDYEDFWSREEPTATDGRTLFHIAEEGESD
jgi:hypothetical protein